MGIWCRGRLAGSQIFFCLVLYTALGCEGEHRDYRSLQTLRGRDAGGANTPGGAGSTGADQSAAPLAQLGTPCTDASICMSGYCSDGVCCDVACTDLCATCAAPGSEGTCSPAASDTECEAIACPGSTECRGRDQTGLALNCDAIGKCKSALTCAPLDQAQGTACLMGAGQCDGSGACIVPGKVALGAACAMDEECAEGNCVLGASGSRICCDSSCDGVCQQCGANGRCELTPAGDSRCPSVTCPADNACRDYSDALTMNLCRGFGQCSTSQDCPFTAVRPAASCDCDTAGKCTVKRSQRCDTSDQCGDGGACVSNAAGQPICCARACAAGLFCAADGSHCVECEDTNVTCEGTTATRCADGVHNREPCVNGCTVGVGCNSEAPVGFSCASAACVEAAVCQTDSTGAKRCCVRDCAAEGKQCSSEGSCVCPPGQVSSGSGCELQRGDPCGTGDAQCGAGLRCVDGVCCNEACAGACESCNLPGSAGVCTFASRDTTGCAPGEQCVARGDCRGGLSAGCGQGVDCVSNNCEPLLGVSGQNVCCSSGCSAPREFCSSDGSRCAQCQSNAECPNGCNVAQGICNPPRALGEVCNVARQCSSGVCLPDASNSQLNRCCPSCAPGQLCSAQGACQNPPLGAGGNCQNDGQCGSGLFCRDGVCCTSACDGPCQSCGANGVCNIAQASDAQRCGAVTCAQQSSACRTVTPPAAGQCAGLGQCAGGAQCTVQLRAAGTACNGNGQCDGAGNCTVDTVAPTVSAGALGSSNVTFDGAQLSWNAASDDRTARASLEYTVVHSFSNNLAGSAQQIRARAGVTVLTGTTGATATNVIFPHLGGQRQSSQFLNVLVRDAAGNESAYAGIQITLSDPARCSQNQECLANVCTTFFFDQDGDGFGTNLTTANACGSGAPAGFVARGGDCCDTDAQAFPGATPRTGVAGFPTTNACDSFDYNCDGTPTSVAVQARLFQECRGLSAGGCTNGTGWDAAIPACGDAGTVRICGVVADGSCQNVSGVANEIRLCL
jgi:hypothetical protein